MKTLSFLPSLSLFSSLVLAAPLIDEHSFKLNARSEGQAPPPPTVLTPTTHWDVATNERTQVHPKHIQSLYYARDSIAHPDLEHQFGSLKVNFSIPAVNVDDSDHVSLDKASGDATITFSSDTAYDDAFELWGSLKAVLLLTYADVCDNYVAGDFCYVVITDSTWNSDTNTAVASARSVDAADVVNAVDFEWGVYQPTSRSVFARDSSNSTVSSNSTASSCGSASNGLSTAATGAGFDERLDACIGSEKVDSASWKSYAKSLGADQEAKATLNADTSKDLEGTLSLLHPGQAEKIANATASHHYQNSTSDFTRLHKRGWFSWFPIKIPFINKPVSAEFRKDLSFSLPSDRGSAESPWGPARLLKKWEGQKTSTGTNGKGSGSVTVDGSVTIYCVDCGASGSITIYGKGSYSLDSGLTEGYVTTNANLAITFQLGVDAQGTLTAKANQQIAAYSLVGLNFGIVTIGPMVTLGADFLFVAEAEGRLLAGAKFSIQNAKSTLDFVDRSRPSSSGWTPSMEPIFEASGQIAVGAEIGVPIAFSVGINILSGKYVKSVGLVERPSIEAKAEFAAEASLAGAKIVKTDGCAGIATQVSSKNELYADIVGYKIGLMAPYTKVLTKGCIPIGSGSNSSGGEGESAWAATQPAIFSATSPNFSGFNLSSGTSYREIKDATGNFFAAACADGNIYLQPDSQQSSIGAKQCGRTFETTRHNVIGDGNSRLIHYYSDAMAKLGVSRLRVHDDADIPKTGEFVSLSAYRNVSGSLTADVNDNADSGKSRAYYVARDAKGGEFYPALCTYDTSIAGMYPKLFLVKDPVKGLNTLMSAEVEGSVTGAKVADCQLVPIRHAIREKGAAFDDQPQSNQGSEGMTDGAKLDGTKDF